MVYLASMANSFWGPFDFFKPQKVLIYNGLSHVNPRRQSNYKDASRLDARIQLHATYSTNTQGLHSWAFEHLRLPSICQVLEVGCGSGQLWLMNHHRLPAGW